MSESAKIKRAKTTQAAKKSKMHLHPLCAVNIKVQLPLMQLQSCKTHSTILCIVARRGDVALAGCDSVMHVRVLVPVAWDGQMRWSGSTVYLYSVVDRVVSRLLEWQIFNKSVQAYHTKSAVRKARHDWQKFWGRPFLRRAA